MGKEWKSVKFLLKNRDNRQWWLNNWGKRFLTAFTGFASLWGVLSAFHIDFTDIVERFLPGSSLVFLILGTLVCLILSGIRSMRELKSYSHIRVEAERAGCSVEVRVADSYLTNAFDNYPNSAMIIGLNKAFWFQEAEPGSLVADMWKRLKEKGITKEEVQQRIDQELQKLWTTDNGPDSELKKTFLDSNRPQVHVKYTIDQKICADCRKKCEAGENDRNCPYDCVSKTENGEEKFETVCRDNYKIGTIVGIDLTWEDPLHTEPQALYKLMLPAMKSGMELLRHKLICFTNRALHIEWENKPKDPKGFLKYIQDNRIKTIPAKKMSKKLYFIANSEVVQGRDLEEPMKVTFDRNASVVESFPRIWAYFEEQRELTPQPPMHILYQPLLIPLIGAGVANEGYTDMEIFSKIVDLYYEHLRASVHAGKHPAIPNLIINIQDKTAIELGSTEDAGSRKIDIKTAFWYLRYRNQVNPVVSNDNP